MALVTKDGQKRFPYGKIAPARKEIFPDAMVVYSDSAHPNSPHLRPMSLSVANHNEFDDLRHLDAQAVGAVFDCYYPDVYRFVCYRLSDETVAEDIASEVFIRLLEAVKSGRGPQTSLKAWLLGTASHIVTDHLRQSYRRPTAELPETFPDESSDPLLDVEQRERSRRLKAAMSTLTEDQQDVLTMRFGQGYSLEETAALIKKNVNSVKQLQFRALAALNRGMAETA